ncbi:MAG: hypothetical protein A3K50_07890 [Planctomycetes bacterium RIFOXYD12_FULL_42_12]|nr:MAG: hypothetical protein A3K50_07890 [Planctomycetes bacterium RIFOXYD12_FULL_42_12]
MGFALGTYEKPLPEQGSDILDEISKNKKQIWEKLKNIPLFGPIFSLIHNWIVKPIIIPGYRLIVRLLDALSPKPEPDPVPLDDQPEPFWPEKEDDRSLKQKEDDEIAKKKKEDEEKSRTPLPPVPPIDGIPPIIVEPPSEDEGWGGHIDPEKPKGYWDD